MLATTFYSFHPNVDRFVCPTLRMAGCVPCFVIPLLLFIFHRYIQPILLKFWNPREKTSIKEGEDKKCEFSCDCSWNKKKEIQEIQENTSSTEEKLKAT